MAEEIFTIDKNKIFEEVAKTTLYTGAKMDDDEKAFDRIFTTDEDKIILNRFWEESKNTICDFLKRILSSEDEVSDVLTIKLELSASFDTSLKASMQSSLISFFVMNITSKWFNFTNKQESAGCAAEAATYLEDVKRKALYKKKPTRPIY
ncbi:MAG: hypothetical protein IKM23_05735 [Bacteroidales bacterium]|nr:hypothetical protein [Bacteroidales bacterium]